MRVLSARVALGALGVLSALALGCYDTPKPECAFLCGANNSCPEEYLCGGDGRCHLDLGGGQLAQCPDTIPTIDASTDGPTPDAALDAAPDAPLPDAGPDGPLPDAAPTTDHVGTISIQDLAIQGHPELGHGLSISMDLTPVDPVQPVVDTAPGTPLGCKVFVYDLTQGQIPPVTDMNHGDVSITGSTAVIPTCKYVPNQGYRCIAGGGAAGAGDVIVDDAGGANTAGLVDMAPAGYTFSAADVGRYLVISGAGAQSGTFPIVGVNPASNTVVYANPAAASGAFTGTYTVIAGLGPVPGAPPPDPLLNTDTVSVSIQPGGDNEFQFPTAMVAVGDSFALDAASQTAIKALPLDGSAVSFDCQSGDCGQGTAAGSLVVINTTDGVIPPGAPDFFMPTPTGKVVIARCSVLGASKVDLPASVMAQIQSSGAKRVRTLFIRTGLTITGNPDSTNPVNVLAGHAVAGFTTAPSVQCTLPSQCGTSNDCVTFTCTNNTCGQQNTMMGVVTSSQTAGDCKEVVCNGNGGTTSNNKDTDVPVDSNQCTKNVCTAGTPSNPPEDAGVTCNQSGGKVCSGAGACVECNGGGDCTSGVCDLGTHTCAAPACTDNVKNGTETDIDCGGAACPKCDNTKSCSVNADCVSGDCNGGTCLGRADGVACSTNPQCANAHCTDGVCCNTTCAGTCQACTAAKKGSGADGTCGAIALGNDPDVECVNGACNGSGACASDPGVVCTTGTQCLSSACIDGVCCNNACGSLCQACNVAGSVGTCTNVPSNTDPANECAGTDVCNGAGACAGVNGSACTQGSECLTGNCVDGVCCNNACAGSCAACSAAKKGGGADGICDFIANGTDPDDECAGASVCDGGGVCTP